MSVPDDPQPPTIDVSADDYAKVAATDQEVPSATDKQARTHQTEEAFQAEKATYTAKIDDGNIWKKLSEIDPPFRPSSSSLSSQSTTTTTITTSASDSTSTSTSITRSEGSPIARRKPDKKEWLLIIAAVGELYWAADYKMILDVCDWAEENFDLDKRMVDSVTRWRERSGEKLAAGNAQEN